MRYFFIDRTQKFSLFAHFVQFLELDIGHFDDDNPKEPKDHAHETHAKSVHDTYMI